MGGEDWALNTGSASRLIEMKTIFELMNGPCHCGCILFEARLYMSGVGLSWSLWLHPI